MCDFDLIIQSHRLRINTFIFYHEVVLYLDPGLDLDCEPVLDLFSPHLPPLLSACLTSVARQHWQSIIAPQPQQSTIVISSPKTSQKTNFFLQFRLQMRAFHWFQRAWCRHTADTLGTDALTPFFLLGTTMCVTTAVLERIRMSVTKFVLTIGTDARHGFQRFLAFRLQRRAC